MTTFDLIVTTALLLACALFVWSAIATVQCFEHKDELRRAEERLEMYRSRLNPYAHLLGRTIEAKVYEGSEWEKMVVVVASWHGALGVRPVSDMYTKTRWIPKHLVPVRVRELDWADDVRIGDLARAATEGEAHHG